VHADLAVAAALRIREPADHAFPLGRPLALSIIRDFSDEVIQQNVVALLPEQHAIGGTPISPRAASLLVILFKSTSGATSESPPGLPAC